MAAKFEAGDDNISQLLLNSTFADYGYHTNTEALKRYVMLAATAPDGVHLSGVVEHKEKFKGSEPVYMLSCGDGASHDDTMNCVKTHLQMLAHHSTSLVPGMVDRIGAPRFQEAMRSTAMGLYNDGEKAKGKVQKRNGNVVDAFRQTLEQFQANMLEEERR